MTTETSSGRKWTVEDILSVKRLSDVQMAADGSRIAYAVRDGYRDQTPDPRANIWVVGTDGSQGKQWTSGPRTDLAPRWSPDSRTLAFISDRATDEPRGIYVLAAEGGEARRLSSVQGNVSDLQWSPDGQWIAYLATQPDREETKQRREKKDDAILFEGDAKLTALWVVRADDCEARQVSTNADNIWEFCWLPDGSGFVLVCSEEPFEWSWYSCYLATLTLAGGPPQKLYEQRGMQVATPSASPDGSHVAFVRGIWSDRGSVGGDVCCLAIGGGKAACLTEGYPGSFASAQWLDNEDLLAIGYHKGEGALFRLGREAAPTRLWSGEVSFAERWQPRFSLNAYRSVLAVVREDHGSPPDVWTATVPVRGQDREVEWRRLTESQPDLKAFVSGDPKTLHWTSADGTSVQGILLKPAGYDPQIAYPLITVVHGGPSALYNHSYITSYFWAALLVSEGYLVLLPNPRGSTGWGRHFAEANLGDMGGGDLQDVLAGVDHVVQSGLANSERLGLCGWSYGGFMAAWGITQTTRFAAAIVGAGIVNWRSFHGVSNIPNWDRLFNQDNPYREGGRYSERAPIPHAAEVRTPTLILHGERDECVPVGQGYEWYRAMKEHGVDTQLVVYPREGHGITEKAHLEDLMGRVTAWFSQHLGDST